jgi:hypothetical protein
LLLDYLKSLPKKRQNKITEFGLSLFELKEIGEYFGFQVYVVKIPFQGLFCLTIFLNFKSCQFSNFFSERAGKEIPKKTRIIKIYFIFLPTIIIHYYVTTLQ